MTQIRENIVLYAGPFPAADPDSAKAGLRPARPEACPSPSRTLYAGPGVSAVRKAWPSSEGGMDVDKALRDRGPRPCHRPHSPPPSPLRWDPEP